MNQPWNERLTREIDAAASEARSDFRAQLRADLADEWNGRPNAAGAMPTANASNTPRRGWLMAAAAAAMLVIVGLIVATRPDGGGTVVSPTPTEPAPAPAPAPVTTAAAPTPTAPDVTMTSQPAATTTSEPPPDSSPSINVPVTPTTPLPLRSLGVVGYGTGVEQVEVLNGEFPPPAVLVSEDVVVLEDSPQSGLTGRGVMFSRSTGEFIQEVTFPDLEPGGTPIAVAGTDEGAIVIVTVHDDAPRVHIRRYIQDRPTVYDEFGRADIEALGDSELRITHRGVEWGGQVVLEPTGLVQRAEVSSDPAFGFSSEFAVSRAADDGSASAWDLSVDFDNEFPPVGASPRVEPFGDGVLFTVRNSSAQFAQPPIIVLRRDGTADVWSAAGWRLDGVREDGALFSRSTPAGLELALLDPEVRVAPPSLADWSRNPNPGGDLDALPLLLPSAAVAGQPDRVEYAVSADQGGRYDYVQTWFADDASGYLSITTNLDQLDNTPEDFRAAVDVPGWDDAYFARSAPEFANLSLIAEGGVVWVSGVGLSEDRVVEIARSLRRIEGREGWEFDATDGPALIAFDEASLDEIASRAVTWRVDGSLTAQLEIRRGLAETMRTNWQPEIDARIVDVGEHAAVVTEGAGLTAVTWSPEPGVQILFGIRGTADEALKIARSIGPVDLDTWTSIPEPASTNDGCDSLFC